MLEIEFRDVLYLSELVIVIWEILNDPKPVTSSGVAFLVTWISDSLGV